MSWPHLKIGRERWPFAAIGDILKCRVAALIANVEALPLYY